MRTSWILIISAKTAYECVKEIQTELGSDYTIDSARVIENKIETIRRTRTGRENKEAIKQADTKRINTLHSNRHCRSEAKYRQQAKEYKRWQYTTEISSNNKNK